MEAGLGVVALVVFSPLMAVAALAVKVSSPGPVLFRQERVGRYGTPFTLVKFRTMRVHGVGPRFTAGDDSRITRAGRLLRRTKIDELPELWNLVRGDISLVGPRPEVPEYVDMRDPLWRRALEVRPGITDPVTLRLRDEEALLQGVPGDRERFYRDVLQPWKLRGSIQYVSGRTWRSDMRVLAGTLAAIARPRRSTLPSPAEIERELLRLATSSVTRPA